MTTLYIDGPDNGGEGVYDILTDQGEHLASHFCSDLSFSLGDLEANRPERQVEWKKRFGGYKVLFLGNDDMTRDRLKELNKTWFAKADRYMS